MVMKRILEEDDGSLGSQSKRPRPMVSAMREVMGAQCMQRHISKLEPFLRRVVQEEVENALCRFVHPTPRLPINRIQATVSRQYRLQFQNSLPHTLFTGSRIEAEGRVPVQIVIIDTDSNKTVTSGPLSSNKIEILVLDGDFGGDSEEQWTEKEFGDSVVREREGKRPLLTGEVIITLNNGVGCLSDATFTDNSSWIRSRKFRLGARIYQSRCNDGIVREAISEAFLVKDHRGELYKKHHPPSLDDDVWRLEKIGKDGAFHRRLAENGIYTVQDFLKNLVMDQDRLRSLLGNGMSNKVWEATLEHAKECVLDDKFYSYCGGPVAVLFNSIFELVGTMFDHTYHSLDDLTASQKAIVNKLKQVAYKNPNEIIELNLPVVDTLPRPQPPIDANSVPQTSSVHEIPDLPVPHQDESVNQLGFSHGSHAQCNELLDSSQLKDHLTGMDSHLGQSFASSQANSLSRRDFLDTPFTDYQTSGLAEDHLMGYDPDINTLCSPQLPVLWDHGNELTHASGFDPSGDCTSHVPNIDSRISSGKWVKLVAALKWVSVSKQLAAKKAKIVDLDYQKLASSICDDAHGGWLG